MAQGLSAIGRRILAQFPPWVEDEAAYIAAEGGPEVSIRGYDLAAFTDRLGGDPHISPSLSEAEVGEALASLTALGVLEEPMPNYWKMTKLGWEMHCNPSEMPPPIAPGPVTIELDPAQSEAVAPGGEVG